MRRFLTVFLFALLALPFVASAQDRELAWELSDENYLDVTDLGFRFYYPVGWVWDVGDNGIVIASTQADLDAQLDDDDNTLAEGQVITLLGIPMSALPEENQNADLDTLADFLVEAGQITEKERFEVPVLSRRSIWVIGENSVGRSGVGTFWTQNGYVILANLGGPDEATISDLMFTWGFTLGTMQPLEAETLGEGMLASDVSQFTMNYPDSWTADPDQPAVVVYELESDVGQQLADLEGINLSVIDAPLTDIGFEADATLEAISTSMGSSFGLDETATQEEFVFLDQPAIVSWGEIDDGSGGKRGLILTSSVVDGNAVVFVLLAPSLERAAEFMPTWVAMMQSVTSTAA